MKTATMGDGPNAGARSPVFSVGGIDIATADSRYVRKNALQVAAADFVSLGAAPPASGAIRIDAASFADIVASWKNGAGAAGNIVVTAAGFTKVGATLGALTLRSSGLDRWMINDEAAGTSSITSIQPTMRIIGGGTLNSIRDAANVNDNASWTDAGVFTFRASLIAGGNVTIADTGVLIFGVRSTIRSSADGILTLANNANNDINRVCWGGTTNAFPSLKRFNATLLVRNGDDTAYSTITADGCLSVGPTTGMGYAAGAGGTVAQITNKATGVTLNKVCGEITMNGAALAANTTVSFVLTDSAIAATDYVSVLVKSGGTAGAYNVWTEAPAAGSVTVFVRNITAGSLSEAIKLTFIVDKAVIA